MPSLPDPLPSGLRDAVEAAAGHVGAVQRVGGGDVSEAARLETPAGAVFAKWGTGAAGAGYAAEAEGLAALGALAGPDLVVPTPLDVRAGQGEEAGWLVLDWIEPGRPSSSDWRRFGRALADLHRRAAPGDGRYGWASDNWIGSKPQLNGWHASWPDFFGERRLRAQAGLVRRRGAWRSAWDAPLDRLVARLGEILPAAPRASLLHGDLWAGNAVATADGRFALIDPAVYVGHGEADIGLTELFGGFEAPFAAGYREVLPDGDAAQREVYNLFHRINHLTHGPGYARGVEATLGRFGR